MQRRTSGVFGYLYGYLQVFTKWRKMGIKNSEVVKCGEFHENTPTVRFCHASTSSALKLAGTSLRAYVHRRVPTLHRSQKAPGAPFKVSWGARDPGRRDTRTRPFTLRLSDEGVGGTRGKARKFAGR